MAVGFSQNFNLKRHRFAKALQALIEHPKLSRDEFMSKVGVGDNEAESIVTWFGKTGLRNNKSRTLTNFGQLIAKYDPCLEQPGTQWFLHYQLAQNPDAEVWFHLTNRFLPTRSVFTFDDALESLKSAGIGEHSPKHLVSDARIYFKALTADEGLGQIHFIEPIENSVFKRGVPQRIHPLFVAYVIYSQREKHYPTASTSRILNLLTDDGNVGKVLSLARDGLEKILEKLRFEGLIDVSHTADLDQVGFTYKGSAIEILERYYQLKG